MLPISEFTAYYPEIKEIISNVSQEEHPRYLNISREFAKGKAVFTLDGSLLFDFNALRKPFLNNYGSEGFDYAELKKADKKYRSRIVFIDTSGKRSFILEINPVYSALHLKSDYKKVNKQIQKYTYFVTL